MMHLPLVGVWEMRLGTTQRHMSVRARAKHKVATSACGKPD